MSDEAEGSADRPLARPEASRKIVVLDGHTINPGDLSWNELESLGELIIHERTPPEAVIARAADAVMALTNKTILNAEAIRNLESLEYIGVLATGYNVVDLEAADRRGITVTNVPAYSTQSVVQMTFAHLLNLTQRVAHHARVVREGMWSSSKDFCFWDYPLVELAGCTMGIIGYGRIGKAVARVARNFGMNVVAFSPSLQPGSAEGSRVVSLDDLFATSDVVSLHCPLNERTERIINPVTLRLMKPGAFLINTGRGGLVDEEALADALNSGRIAGAGIDVLSTEPPSMDNPLIVAKNCFITPHIAWATRSSRERLLKTVIENVRAYIQGEPINVVNNPQHRCHPDPGRRCFRRNR